MKFSESTLRLYAAPLSDTEDIKCKNAITAIRDALKNLGYTDDQKPIDLLEIDTLAYAISMRGKSSTEKIHIFIQGSYANNTCVRNESDVDIAIMRDDVHEYAFGDKFDSYTTKKKEEAVKLKDAVEIALRSQFPYQVHRGNKSIKVDGNTYRKPVDTVPCLAMNYYYKSHLDDYLTHHQGVLIFADDGSITTNFPKQHIADKGYACADSVSSFELESLLWNFPDFCFTKYTSHGFAFEEIVNYAYKHKVELSSYYEANGIKKLCTTQQEVNCFAEFIDKLYLFFEFDYRL